MNNSSSQNGFMLLEFIIYSVITAALVGILVLVGVNVLEGRAKVGMVDDINYNGRIATQIIVDSIQQAESINYPLPDSKANVLKISTEEEESVIFEVDAEGVLIIKRGGVSSSLTNQKVKVSNLLFTNVSYGASRTIRVEMEIKYRNPTRREDYDIRKTFYITESMKKAGYPVGEDCSQATVGSFCGGGIVAGQGLIVYWRDSIVDNSTSIQWGCYDQEISPSATSTSDGQTNTANIVNFHDGWAEPYSTFADAGVGDCHADNDGTMAARVCSEIDNGYDDWYLPSANELNAIYLVYKEGKITNFSDATGDRNYWSSTEDTQYWAVNQNFVLGGQVNYQKHGGRRVRCVRYDANIGQHILNISSNAYGSVVSPGEGGFPYHENIIVDLVAEASIGYDFIEWTGDVETIGSATSTSTTITINGSYDIEAVFEGPCERETAITIDGQIYPLVEIGNQCWMAENINYDGHTSGSSWCYDNNTTNCDLYGRLYDWDAAMSVCPEGWKLPSDNDLKLLEGTVDSTYGVGHAEWDKEDGRGDDAGDNLKTADPNWYGETPEWVTGFDALPGGYRHPTTGFHYIGERAYWWTSSLDGSSPWGRSLYIEHPRVGRYSYINKNRGRSVRCLQGN